MPEHTGELVEELVPHVAPMLNRLEKHIRLPNASRLEILDEYPRVVTTVLLATATLAQAYHLPEITADEVGFLSLYIAQYMESTQRL